LVSITAFFIALVLAYAMVLPPKRTDLQFSLPYQVMLSTSFLVASSFILERARYVLRRARVYDYKQAIVFTTALGFAFVLTQAWGWWELTRQGIVLQGNPRGSAFFVFSGLHGAHVAGGLLALLFLFRRSRLLSAENESDLRKARAKTQIVSLYWHFMGVLWLVLLWILFLWA
jgi:cytochrome c oxidase subunit 3